MRPIFRSPTVRGVLPSATDVAVEVDWLDAAVGPAVGVAATDWVEETVVGVDGVGDHPGDAAEPPDNDLR